MEGRKRYHNPDNRGGLPEGATENYLKTKMAMADPPLQTYSPFNSDFQPSRFRRDVPRASREVLALAVQEAGLGGEVQRGQRQDQDRRRVMEREDEVRRQDGELKREAKLHQKRMEDQEREQADRRRRHQKEFEREEEQNQSELRDKSLRSQTAREEATLREVRMITGAAETEWRTAEAELREVQEGLRRARQGEGLDIHAVVDGAGPELSMSYVPCACVRRRHQVRWRADWRRTGWRIPGARAQGWRQLGGRWWELGSVWWQSGGPWRWRQVHEGRRPRWRCWGERWAWREGRQGQSGRWGGVCEDRAGAKKQGLYRVHAVLGEGTPLKV